MSNPIQVGGSYTCKACGQWCDGSMYHDCSPSRNILLDRPVSQDAQEVAEKVVKNWYSGNFVAVGAKCQSDLIDRIAAALQSHADAARQAERERIRGAVATMLIPNPTIDLEDAWYNTALGRVMAAIDGQPVGGDDKNDMLDKPL